MKRLKGPARAAQVREMFGNISGRYDFVNRLITFGLDRSWRRYVVRRAELPKCGRLLDVGSGTGDIAFEALRRDPTLSVTAVDYSFQMMQVGYGRPYGHNVSWCLADALQLPFPNATFDAVTSGYLVRNVIDVQKAFEEQIRVVKPGGRVVCLDTSPDPWHILRPLVLLYLNFFIPLLGHLITRNRAAYMYLQKSTLAFMTPDQLSLIMKKIGLSNVSYHKFMLGTMAVYTGVRPGDPSPL